MNDINLTNIISAAIIGFVVGLLVCKLAINLLAN